jgi:DNA-binding MarR family transcriptional regulator
MPFGACAPVSASHRRRYPAQCGNDSNSTEAPGPVTKNPLKDLPGYLLRRASAWTMAELAKRLEELELTPTEASVLVVIASNPGIIQREIGQMLGIVSANMTPLVSRLEDRELIRRLPVDKRSFGLRTTRRGGAIADRAYAAMQAQETTLIDSVAPKNRTAFLQTLQDIASAIDE